MSSSIPSWQILTAHAQPFKGARDLAFCLKVPLDSLLVWASSPLRKKASFSAASAQLAQAISTKFAWRSPHYKKDCHSEVWVYCLRMLKRAMKTPEIPKVKLDCWRAAGAHFLLSSNIIYLAYTRFTWVPVISYQISVPNPPSRHHTISIPNIPVSTCWTTIHHHWVSAGHRGTLLLGTPYTAISTHTVLTCIRKSLTVSVFVVSIETVSTFVATLTSDWMRTRNGQAHFSVTLDDSFDAGTHHAPVRFILEPVPISIVTVTIVTAWVQMTRSLATFNVSVQTTALLAIICRINKTQTIWIIPAFIGTIWTFFAA